MSDVTNILSALQQGDPKAAEELLPLLYGELRKLAAYRMAMRPNSSAQLNGPQAVTGEFRTGNRREMG